MDINFKFDGERYLDNITWDMMIVMESHEMSYVQSKAMLAVFLTDPEGNYYPMDEALRILGGLTVRKITEAANQFYAFVQSLGSAQVPLAVREPLSTQSTMEDRLHSL